MTSTNYNLFKKEDFIAVSKKLKKKVDLLEKKMLFHVIYGEGDAAETIICRFKYIITYFDEDATLSHIFQIKPRIEQKKPTINNKKGILNPVYVSFVNNILISSINVYTVIKNDIPGNLDPAMGYIKLSKKFEDCVTYHGLPVKMVVRKLYYSLRRGETEEAIKSTAELYSLRKVHKNVINKILEKLLFFAYTEVTPVETEYVNDFVHSDFLKTKKKNDREVFIRVISIVQLLSGSPKSNLVMCAKKVYNDPRLREKLGLSPDFECEFEILRDHHISEYNKNIADERFLELLANLKTYIDMKDFEAMRILGIIESEFPNSKVSIDGRLMPVYRYVWLFFKKEKRPNLYKNLDDSAIPIYHMCANEILSMKNALFENVSDHAQILADLDLWWNESKITDDLLRSNYDLTFDICVIDPENTRLSKKYYELHNVDVYSYDHKLHQLFLNR
jgi:hypothetical protein